MEEFNAVIYARCSKEEQAIKDLSIPSQLEECRKWAKSKGYQIIGEYIDEGLSGTKSSNRPEFLRMIREVEHRIIKPDAVIVWAFSRFARNRYDSIYFKTKLSKKGVSFISVTEPIPDDSIFAGVYSAFIEASDELHSLRIGVDTRRGMRFNAKQGYWNGGRPPLGFDKKKIVLEGGKTRTILIRNEIEAKWVALIYDLYLAGRSLAYMERKMHEIGAKTKVGKSFTKTSFYSILTNPLNKGCYVWNRYAKEGSKFKDEKEWIYSEANMEHIRIVSDEKWDKVQEMLAMRRKSSRRNIVSGFWLSGLLICDTCNSKYYSQKLNNRKIEYYRCWKCHRCLRRKDVEKAAEEVIKRRILTKEMYFCIQRELNQLGNEIGKQLKKYESNLLEVERKLLNCMEAIENGIQSLTLKERIKDLENQKSFLNSEIIYLKNQNKMVSIEEVKNELEALVADFENAADFQSKKQVAKILIEEVRVKEDKSLYFKLLGGNLCKTVGAGSLTTFVLHKKNSSEYIFVN